ncbi:hypothetical protein [Polycladidibacter hongkongensis]|uniref:hypothetical protein n=1 Tax=Polycladidibacter hongkongensis TaxID=1647556 RepID=UPI000831E716|nr:hypothetical protein [Pseudovibrio hongkongensis]
MISQQEIEHCLTQLRGLAASYEAHGRQQYQQGLMAGRHTGLSEGKSKASQLLETAIAAVEESMEVSTVTGHPLYPPEREEALQLLMGLIKQVNAIGITGAQANASDQQPSPTTPTRPTR